MGLSLNKKLFPILTLLFTLLSYSNPIFGNDTLDAFETVAFDVHRMQISEGGFKSIPVKYGWAHIKKLFIQAYGINSPGTVEVIVNGQAKGTIYVPGKDPNYIVTVGEVARSIEFRQVSGGPVMIEAVWSEQSERLLAPAPTSGPEFPGLNEATLLSLRAIDLVNRLEPYASYSEYGTYLLPVKKLGAAAYAASSAKGPLSLSVRESLLRLRKQIQFAELYLDTTFEREYAFELAVALKRLGYDLDRLMN